MAAILVAVSACSGGGDDPAASPTATGSSAPAQGKAPLGVVPMTLAAGSAHVELTALSRTSDKAVTGQFRVTNDGSAALRLAVTMFEAGQAQRSSLVASGIGLLDGTGNKLYMPLWTTDNKCLCSNLSSKVVPPGGSADMYAVFPAPPANVSRVSVVLPHTVPIQDVPLGSGPVQPLQDQTIDPATASLAPPRILPVRSTIEGDEQSTDDNSDDRAIRLSSDVLFALNKADLTARAAGLLDGVAKQIDESTGTSVKVDGYTDTTGNDAINQPLSERRAKTVADRLKSQVTRQGVTFQEAGHGSRDPVASNSTEQGRRKNRRVTVTFTRPQPKPAAPPAAGGEPYKWTNGGPTVVKSASFTPPAASGLKIEVNSLHRDASGVTTLVWTLRNEGNRPLNVAARLTNFNAVFASNAGTASGLELVDTTAKLRYQPLHTSDNRCLCAEFIRAGAKAQVGPGEAATFADVYKLPPELQTVELQAPWGTAQGATVPGLTVK